MNNRTDQQWIQELDGEGSVRDEALTDLYDLLYRRLCAYLHIRSRTFPALAELHSDEIEELAADFAQDSLLRIWERREQYKGAGPFLHWAFIVALRLASAALERMQWMHEIPVGDVGNDDYRLQQIEDDPIFAPEQQALLQSMLDEIATIIEKGLTPLERIVFLLYYACDWPTKECARYLNIVNDSSGRATTNSVSKTLARAREKIGTALIEANYEVNDVVNMPMVAWEPLNLPDFECPDIW
ncbi:MAG: sigma-70 family RNA polymerase sigma factor [Caldilineaceae bacterium]|nr:sigma-70 family RNA polymerase sigma factor [Caldilineaceae bacterium]